LDKRKESREVQVEICHSPFGRKCDADAAGGEVICTDEHETVCETTVGQHLVDEDVPECETVYEEACQDGVGKEPDCIRLIGLFRCAPRCPGRCAICRRRSAGGRRPRLVASA